MGETIQPGSKERRLNRTFFEMFYGRVKGRENLDGLQGLAPASPF